jgi:hypothetical protein
MSENTITFELPIGYTKDGVTHKTVVMRPMTGADQLAVARDSEIAKMAKDGVDYTMDFGSVNASVDDAGELNVSGAMDPIRTFITRAAVVKLNTVLFTQVVESLGDIVKPNKNIFRQLEASDLQVIEQKHAELNGLDEDTIKKLKEKAGDTSPSQ